MDDFIHVHQTSNVQRHQDLVKDGESLFYYIRLLHYCCNIVGYTSDFLAHSSPFCCYSKQHFSARNPERKPPGGNDPPLGQWLANCQTPSGSGPSKETSKRLSEKNANKNRWETICKTGASRREGSSWFGSSRYLEGCRRLAGQSFRLARMPVDLQS